jgi:NAD(P)-dependent dehydrogenase (short-subunit alcohol dehydrogenase family)
LELRNKVCLLAGASGAIGSAIAEAFHQEGARLALTSLTPQRRDRLHTGKIPDAFELALDVSHWPAVRDAVGRILEKFGIIDVLVNCTGVIGPIGPTASISVLEWTRTIHVNLLGSFHLTRAVLPCMLSRSSGKIIHLSGGGAAYGRPFYTAYSASKAALVRFTESLAEELRDSHIDVNAIAPGPVYSRMWEQMKAAAQQGGEHTLRELKKMQETGGVPAQSAARLAVFLASPRSDGLTGKLISAPYDNWPGLDHRIEEITNSEAGTLRRVPLG